MIEWLPHFGVFMYNKHDEELNVRREIYRLRDVVLDGHVYIIRVQSAPRENCGKTIMKKPPEKRQNDKTRWVRSFAVQHCCALSLEHHHIMISVNICYL